MDLTEEVGQFKSEFAKQIAMEEGKARNMNILRLQGQHSLKRGTSESGLGNCNKSVTDSRDLSISKFHGSVGSLPSLDYHADDFVEDESWVTSEQFKDILEQKEKEISKEGMMRLEKENAELRKRLEFADRRSSSVSLLGRNKFQELERDVTKLQAKICKMEQSSQDPNSTRRLVTFLETFKSQLPIIDTSVENHYDSGLDRTESYRPSIDSYRQSVQNYRPSIDSYDFVSSRPSMGSYRAACREPLPGRADSCVAQFSRANAAALGFEVISDRTGSVGSTDFDGEVRGSRPARSRVMMGAKTVQRARYLGSIRGRSGRAFSSSDLLGESRVREDGYVSSAEEAYGEKTPQSMNRSMQSRAKSYSNVLSYRDAADVASTSKGSGKDAVEDGQVFIPSSVEEKIDKCVGEVVKIKGKEETKVQKFFKRIKKMVTKDTKVKEEEEVKVPGKMTRSLSHRIGKSKNPPKRLKSFHASSPRLRKEFNLN